MQLEQLKKTVDDLQARLTLTKGDCKKSLKTLEMVSDEVHESQRPTAMGLGAAVSGLRAARCLCRTCRGAKLSQTLFLWP